MGGLLRPCEGGNATHIVPTTCLYPLHDIRVPLVRSYLFLRYVHRHVAAERAHQLNEPSLGEE